MLLFSTDPFQVVHLSKKAGIRKSRFPECTGTDAFCSAVAILCCTLGYCGKIFAGIKSKITDCLNTTAKHQCIHCLIFRKCTYTNRFYIIRQCYHLVIRISRIHTHKRSLIKCFFSDAELQFVSRFILDHGSQSDLCQRDLCIFLCKSSCIDRSKMGTA